MTRKCKILILVSVMSLFWTSYFNLIRKQHVSSIFILNLHILSKSLTNFTFLIFTNGSELKQKTQHVKNISKIKIKIYNKSTCISCHKLSMPWHYSIKPTYIGKLHCNISGSRRAQRAHICYSLNTLFVINVVLKKNTI